MSKHYWPTEPGMYLVEFHDGSVERIRLHQSGVWLGDGSTAISEVLASNGYLGVRTPFSEEAERVEFEAALIALAKGSTAIVEKDADGNYVKWEASYPWWGWLARARRERGIA